MTLEAFEIEGHALSLFRDAGLDPARAPSPAAIANALPDVDVEYVLRASRPASLGIVGGRATIRILNTSSATARAWFIAHELGEWILHRSRVQHEAAEHFADNLAAAIIAPRAAVLAVRARCGGDLRRTARALRVTQTIAALRWGEVFGRPVVMLDRSRAKTRGAIEVPSERDLRRIAAAGGGDGLTVIPVTDAPGRVLLVGDW